MSQIEITCIDQTAIFTNMPEIFSGDVNVDTVKFNFDNSWDNYETKTAVFYNNPKETYPVMLDGNDVAVIPKEVMARKSKLSIGVFGTNVNGDVKTSKILTYTIGRGAISDELDTNSSSMDVWVQLLTRQLYFEDEINTKVDTLSDDVDTVEAIAKGRNQALAYNGYSEMITALNSMSADELKRGQNIYIATLGVPDLWVYGVEETNVEYTYVDDDTFVEGLNVNTTVQAGHYKLAQLETQKVDVGGITNDINTLQDDVESLEGRVDNLENNLGADEVSVDDTNLALGGTTVQDILELINTKIDTEIAKTYDRWWWKTYKTVTGTTAIDLSDLDYNEIKIKIACVHNSVTFSVSPEYTIKNIPSDTENKTTVSSDSYPRLYASYNISKNSVKIMVVRYYGSTSGSYSDYTSSATLTVQYR